MSNTRVGTPPPLLVDRGRGERLDGLLLRYCREQRRGAGAGHGMPPTGRHLNKRSQHKGPLCEPRVREDEGRSAPVAGVLDDLTVIVQEGIEIEGAGRARDTAPAPEVRLDLRGGAP